MTWRRPLLSVTNSAGNDIMPKLAGLWTSVSTCDKAGNESDGATIVCIGPPALIMPPNRGEIYEIAMGWADEGLVSQGRFSFQKPSLSGDPSSGETMLLQFRSADFVEKLKKTTRKGYDDKTFGEIMQDVGKEAGLPVQVDPELGKIKLGYRLRWDQSLIDFVTELGEEVGATVKPAGGKLVAMKRGGASSASGKPLEPILIRRSECGPYSVEIDPRPETGKVAAAYHDEKSGRRKHVKKSSGRDGPTAILPHPYRTEAEAGLAADAASYDRVNASGSGNFDLPGRPRAWAEAPCTIEGFGPLIDGSWKADTVTKIVTARGGFRTEVAVTAGKDQKGKGNGKAGARKR